MKIVLAALMLSAGTAAATPVQAARALPDGTPVNLNEVVVTSMQDTVGSASVMSFFVRDTTAAFGAINIFGSQGSILALNLKVGDVISIIGGSRGSFRGFAEITFPGAITQVASPTMAYDSSAMAVTAADFQDFSATAEGLESQLVSISGVFADALDAGTAWAGFTNYTFNDGLGTFFTVRVATNDIANALNAQVGGIGTGAMNLEGIFGQFDFSAPFDTGYQLLLTPSPASAGLLALGGLMATRRRRS